MRISKDVLLIVFFLVGFILGCIVFMSLQNDTAFFIDEYVVNGRVESLYNINGSVFMCNVQWCWFIESYSEFVRIVNNESDTI